MADNNFQNVSTFNKSLLAQLQNQYCFIDNSNSRYKNFETIKGQLGSTVTFDSPPQVTTVNSLNASFQSLVQKVHTLTVDQPISSSFEVTDIESIFNMKPMDYMKVFGASAVTEIGSQIEADIATLAETSTYRFYGDGLTPINSTGQLAEAMAYHRTFGAAKNNCKGYLQDIAASSIINDNFNYFVLDRNERQYMSWEIGNAVNTDWYQSNLLKRHNSGSEGNEGTTLTVVSTVKNSDGAVISITFSGASAPSDPDSIKAFDKCKFLDTASRKLRFVTYFGHKPCAAPVQFAATADAASTAGSQVTISINPPLQAASGQGQNITSDIVPGDTISVLPDHICGLITCGDPLFLAMPKLGTKSPYETSSITDPDSGISLRMYAGATFGKSQDGIVHDAIWGKTLVSDYTTMIAFPV